MTCKTLQPGDLIFMRGTSCISKLITTMTPVGGAKFSHVAVYLGDNTVFDTIGGVKIFRTSSKNFSGSRIRGFQEMLKDTVVTPLGVARLDYPIYGNILRDVCEFYSGSNYSLSGCVVGGYFSHLDRKILNSENVSSLIKKVIRSSRNLSEAKKPLFIYKLSKGNYKYCSSLSILCIQEYLNVYCSANNLATVSLLGDSPINHSQLSPNDLFDECKNSIEFKTFLIKHPMHKLHT